MNFSPNTSVTKILFTAISLSIGSPSIPSYNHPPPTRMKNEIRFNDTKSLPSDYITEKYNSQSIILNEELVAHIEFLKLTSLFAIQQRDLDPEFESLLNEFESSIINRVPTKRRL